MSNRLTIKKVANRLGVSTKTMRRWEESKFFVPERDPHTGIRLYHPYAVEYWEKYLSVNRKYENHLKELSPINKELSRHLVMSPLAVNQKLPMLDTEAFLKAEEKLDIWEKEHKKLLKEVLELPVFVKKAILQMETEEK